MLGCWVEPTSIPYLSKNIDGPSALRLVSLIVWGLIAELSKFKNGDAFDRYPGKDYRFLARANLKEKCFKLVGTGSTLAIKT